MRKFVKIVPAIIVGLCSVTASITAMGQLLPETPTIEDVGSLHDEVTAKIKAIPTEEYPIRAELDWARNASMSIRGVINDNRTSGSKPDLDEFRQELGTVLDELAKVNCDDVQQARIALDRLLRKARSLSNSMEITRYDESDSKSWQKISEKWLTYPAI